MYRSHNYIRKITERMSNIFTDEHIIFVSLQKIYKSKFHICGLNIFLNEKLCNILFDKYKVDVHILLIHLTLTHLTRFYNDN